MLFGISIVAIAAGGGGGGNAGLQANMAGTGFQIRLSDPDTQMSNEGGTYVLNKKCDPKQDIVFTFSLNPNGGQKGFGIYPAKNEEPAGFDGVNIYEKSDPNKIPVLSLGGNYSQDTMNPDFFFEETYDASYPDHYVFNLSTEASFSNERTAKLTIKAGSLKPGKKYCLYFPSTIKTYNNGNPKQLGSDVTIEFETDVDPEAPHISPMTTSKLSTKYVSYNAATGYGTVAHSWEDGEVVMEVRIDPKGVFADSNAEENYKQFSLSSYYGAKIPVKVGPGRTNSNYTFYRVDMALDPGWYCLTVGKDFKNNSGKTIGDFTGGEDYSCWILMTYHKSNSSGYLEDMCVDLTTNLQNMTYEDVSADNTRFEPGRVAMGYEDATCPDYLVKLTAVEGYALPDNVSVSVSGKELTAGKDYTYTPEALQTETGKDGEHEYNLKVDRHAINGPVVITASAVKPVTGVSLDKTELTLDEGDSATLAATVSPEDASNKNVTWTSSDEKVATVDATGKVTAIKAGTATITVTTEDGEKTATCAVTVNHKHVEEVVPGKAATCTEKGLTDGKKCSVCDAVLEEQEEIPALGHDFKDGKCTRCDAADPDYKPTPVEPVSKFTGLANEADKDGVWWYYTDGKIDKTHTGVDQNKYGWWRVENGKVNFNAQSIYQNENGWWKTTDGKVTFKENSIYQNQYGWWKCKDSKVDFTAQSIYQNQYGWWKTTNGKVTFKENGLFKNQYGTWKVENSKVNFNYNGTYQGKTIKNGKVQ